MHLASTNINFLAVSHDLQYPSTFTDVPEFALNNEHERMFIKCTC